MSAFRAIACFPLRFHPLSRERTELRTCAHRVRSDSVLLRVERRKERFRADAVARAIWVTRAFICRSVTPNSIQPVCRIDEAFAISAASHPSPASGMAPDATPSPARRAGSGPSAVRTFSPRPTRPAAPRRASELQSVQNGFRRAYGRGDTVWIEVDDLIALRWWSCGVRIGLLAATTRFPGEPRRAGRTVADTTSPYRLSGLRHLHLHDPETALAGAAPGCTAPPTAWGFRARFGSHAPNCRHGRHRHGSLGLCAEPVGGLLCRQRCTWLRGGKRRRSLPEGRKPFRIPSTRPRPATAPPTGPFYVGLRSRF